MIQKNRLSILSVIFFTLFSCGTPEPKKEKTVSGNVSAKNDHSFANVEQIRTNHLHLELDIDFERQTIYGVARHEMIRLKDTDTAIFDINGPKIQKITLGEKGKEKETNFIIGAEKEFLGSPLSVKIEKDTKYINIYYQTSEKDDALDWLPANLTAGKKHPYLYTQGQAILTRSWIPLQCTPAVRITYSADVKVPKELMAVMSAKNPVKKNETGMYHFEMKQRIPSYLIALAVGNLSYKSIGKNCGVYTEPEMLQSVAWEFADISKMITAAEKLYGKYQWEQYDVIVLPYSFPFGGMENPRLTFANPTLISGDRSAVSVIAHELAHSWSGNLVTNASWDDFWLNEGFTVYFENRIMEELYGKEKADMLALIEFQELKDEIETMKAEGKEKDTHLKLQLKSRNPDDGMTDIAYVKGCFFLKTLERDFGRERFDAFLKGYFQDHAFTTLTTEDFRKYLMAKLIKPNNIKFNVDEWLYKPGLPKNCYALTSPRFEKIQAIADDFAKGKNIFVQAKKKKGKKREPLLTRDLYTPQEWQAFIRKLPKNISKEKLKEIDVHLNFKSWGNCEVATEWYVLGIQNGYEEILPNVEKFVMQVGRRKFALPIYKALASSKQFKPWGIKTFEKAKANYHAVTKGSIEPLFK